jgi:hypothetical protein
MAIRKIVSRIVDTTTLSSTGLDVATGTGTGAALLPKGTTNQRPASPVTGNIRYNTTLNLYEQYTDIGWSTVDAPPTVTSISGTINENTNSTITITGTGFKTGAIVFIEGNGVSGTPRALTTTYVSTTSLTAATAAASVNYVAAASFNVRVTNASGLSGVLSPAGNVDSDPIWSTSAGTLATINDQYGSYSPIATLSASDPEGTSVTYAVASGSLPGNVTLNSSTGAISGDPDNETSASTTYTFTASATSNTQVATRSFNIIVNRTPDGSSSARAATTPNNLRTLGITTNGTYWLKPDAGSAGQFYCVLDGTYGNYGWALGMRYYNPFYYGQLMRNAWDGHNGQNGPAIATASTWDGTYGSYLPDSASYILFGFTNANNNTLTDYAHFAAVGSGSDNSGFWNRSAGYTNSYNLTTVQQNVTGMASGSAVFYFRDTPSSSYDYFARGYGVNLAGPATNVDNTNNLLGAISDACNQFTLNTSGVTSISAWSETYVGSRKNLDGGSGANGSYCSDSSQSGYGKWMMFWR